MTFIYKKSLLCFVAVHCLILNNGACITKQELQIVNSMHSVAAAQTTITLIQQLRELTGDTQLVYPIPALQRAITCIKELQQQKEVPTTQNLIELAEQQSIIQALKDTVQKQNQAFESKVQEFAELRKSHQEAQEKLTSMLALFAKAKQDKEVLEEKIMKLASCTNSNDNNSHSCPEEPILQILKNTIENYKSDPIYSKCARLERENEELQARLSCQNIP